MTTIEQLLAAKRDSPGQRRAIELAKNDFKLLSDLVSVRRECGLSQHDVASRLGITQPAVAAFERHDADPKLSTIRRYAHAVGILVGHVVEKDVGQLYDGLWTPMAINMEIRMTPDGHSKNYQAAANKRWDFALAA